MPVSFSNVTPTNLELTPCRISWNGIDLGASLKNVQVAMSYDKADMKADQFGVTILNRKVSGMTITITTELAETVNKNIWKTVFQHGNLVGSSQAMYFTSQVGADDYSISQPLVLHPLSLPDADKSRDLTFYKAIGDEKSSIVFGPTEQQTLKIVWHVYPDTSVQPAKFAFFGDTSVGLVNASAGSPAFTGTGNGTLTSVAVYNGFTKTETITAKCVGSSSGNDFYVSGSVSGPLFEGHLGSAAAQTLVVSTGVVAFTITQGSVQFVTGDQFTVATVAANYV